MRTLLRSAGVVGVALLLATTVRIGPSNSVAEQLVEAQPRSDGGPPSLPRVTVDVPRIAVTGRTIPVPAGGDLQRALDEAKGGDRITLEPRATYKGPFRLPRKDGEGWIVIASAASTLPAPGRRVTPADAARMPKLVASSGSVFEAAPGAHHYRLVGLEITPADGVALNTLVRLGEDESSLDAMPHHVIIDRCFLHGDATLGGRRGVALNGSHLAVVDSHLSDFKERTVDAQAIAGWNGPGPFRIAGNYLEASGENVMFGGADPQIRDLVPADIEVVRNHMAKPLSWKKDDPAFAGAQWSVKNLFELKNARRVLIDGNLFEYNWPHAQNGFAILFTVRNQDGGAPWSVVEDVTFSNNMVRHVAAGINVLGRDDNQPSQQTRRIAIRNNVFLDVGGRWENGRLFQLLDGTDGVTIEHNTAAQTGSILFAGDHAPHTRFVFQHNVMPHNEHGITGSGTGPGNPTLARFFPGGVFRGNVLIGAPAASYPAGNRFPRSISDTASKNAGGEPGANVGAIEKAMGNLFPAESRTANPQAENPKPNPEFPVPEMAGLSFGIWNLEFGFFDSMFWISLLLLAYVYAGYPVVAALRATLRPRPRIRAAIEPSVSILVAAHNEADRIGARIENLLDLDYPAERMDIVVASDGSTDDTVERAHAYSHRGVAVRPFATRRGKPAVLNAVVPELGGEIVLFADARQRFDRGTLRELVANFADPSVGAVSGELVLRTGASTATAGHGAAFYWRYEKFIRATEGRADSTIGATGAIYAVRRALFEPIPDDTILDDVLIPLRIVRRGFRVVFEARARAYDAASATGTQEFARKARTIAGTFQLFARERWLFVPWRNRLWFETMSHKGLRLLLPLLHAALLGATVMLAAEWGYRLMLVAQGIFYGAAVAGYAQRRAGRRALIFSVPCTICLLSWATIVGFVRFLTDRQRVTWERIPSPDPATPAA